MYNHVTLIGRLVADPELKTTPNGISVCAFRIAVDRPYKQDGEKQADFINITAWRERAEFVSKYFAKGKAIGIDGAIQTRQYTDRDGAKRTAFEVVANRLFFVEPKGTADKHSPDVVPHGSDDYEPVDVGEDDLPFD